jgi:hypothetical protein
MEKPSPVVTSKHSRLFRWIRRGLIAAAGVATIIAIIYTEEDWRGKRAWENCRRDLEAQGRVLEWAAFIPPAVPDDQNIFKAPNMTDWFAGRGARDLSKRMAYPDAPRNKVTAAQLTIISSGARPEPDSTVLDLNDPATPQKAIDLARAAIGPSFTGNRFQTFAAKPISDIKPVKIALRTRGGSAQADLPRVFAEVLYRNKNVPRLVAETTNDYVLNFEQVTSPAEFLAATTPDIPEMAQVRQALRRPLARIDGNYQVDYLTIPVPNFVEIRNLVQFVSDRAKCHLLAGQPEEALRDLTLVHDVCKVLHSRPTGPLTLLGAMIEIAVTGLYADTAACGMRLKVWRDSDLVEIQKQLGELDLLSSLAGALEVGRASYIHMLADKTAGELRDIAKAGKWKPLYVASFLPRGWLYLNLETYARREQGVLDALDLPHGLISPGKTDEVARQSAKDSHIRPDNFLEDGIPNYRRALITCARNQSLANEGYLSCALERYRLARGQYPETLDALVPQFAQKIPCDIVNGKPLRYQRSADGQFLLYSVGWNEKDDAGQPGPDNDTGDWVWGRP